VPSWHPNRGGACTATSRIARIGPTSLRRTPRSSFIPCLNSSGIEFLEEGVMSTILTLGYLFLSSSALYYSSILNGLLLLVIGLVTDLATSDLV